MDEQLTFEFEQRPTIKGFPELRWTGKRPYRSSQYYPAQLRESYGDAQDGWINKIFWGRQPPGYEPYAEGLSWSDRSHLY